MRESTTEILEQADKRAGEWRNHIRDAANLFHENEGQLFTREEALSMVEDSLDIDALTASDTLAALVGDTVDPVVQIPVDGERYIGIIEFETFDGAYGYIEFDDVHGKQKRVVCAQCVHDSDLHSQVTHATSGDPNGSFSSDATYDELVDGIHRHYDDTHDAIPESVETGASLADPTTIGGNESFHKGNDGPNSGMNAEFLQGNTPTDIEDSAVSTANADSIAHIFVL